MQRGITGGYEITSVGGEQVRAFIPHPLPPNPPVDFSNTRQRLVERATLALGRLDSITLLLPDPNLAGHHQVYEDELALSDALETNDCAIKVPGTECCQS